MQMHRYFFIFTLVVGLVSTPSFASFDSEDLEHCIEDLVSLGINQKDAFKECRYAGDYAVDMAHCALGINRFGIRADHAVKECRNQGSRAMAFYHCVRENVNKGVRPDKAVQACR